MTQIDGQAMNGNNATLGLKALDIRNDNGDAVIAWSTAEMGWGYLSRDMVLVMEYILILNQGRRQRAVKISGDYGMLCQGLDGIGIEVLGNDYGLLIEAPVGAPGHALGLLSSVVGGKSISAPDDIAVSDGDLTLAAIADAAWDEAIVGHLGSGSTGEKLNTAGAAGEPWGTALPGLYAPGTAGEMSAMVEEFDAGVKKAIKRLGL